MTKTNNLRAHRYNREAVDHAIQHMSRERITKREARLIHALLKGRQKEEA